MTACAKKQQLTLTDTDTPLSAHVEIDDTHSNRNSILTLPALDNEKPKIHKGKRLIKE
jgi:hypothetical protein